MTIDLDAITRVLAPSIVGSSFNSDKNAAGTGPNPDSDSSHNGDDAGSPDSETEDVSGNNIDHSIDTETTKETNFPLAKSDDSNADAKESETEDGKFVRKQYVDPITKEYVTTFNNFRGRPVYEDEVFDKTKFKITGMG